MKAVRVTTQPDGSFKITPCPLPTIHRTGVASADGYRRQAEGGTSTKNFNPLEADSLRTIILSNGKFKGLAAQTGPLLTIVVAGEVTVIAGPSETAALEAGDILFTDAKSAPAVTLDARNEARLVQIAGLSPGFPGDEAKIQPAGGSIPKPQLSLKRIYKGKDDRAFFASFANIFPDAPNAWSAPAPISGFRMLFWDEGQMDYHPCVVNQIGITLAGELKIETRGGAGETQYFRTGDICMSEDKTGEGHKNSVRGGFHSFNIVVPVDDHWPMKP